MGNIISHRIGYVDQPQLSLDRVAAVGVTHVEIVVREPGQTAKDIAAILKPHGLKTGSVSTPCTIGEDSVFDTFETYSALAEELGAGVLFTSVHSHGMEMQQVYDRMRRIGDIAAKHGVMVAMETHPDLCQNGDQQVERMSAIGHPNVGVNFDPANIYYYNHNVNAIEELRKSKQYVKAVHLKDTMGGFEDPRFPILGQGVVDFKGLFSEMASVGFHGPFAMELEGPVVASDNTSEAMEQIVVGCLDHLRSIGAI